MDASVDLPADLSGPNVSLNVPEFAPLGTTPARHAAVGDLPALVALERSSFSGDRLSPRSWRRLLDRPSASILVIDHGGAIGGAAVLLFRRGAAVARLYSIAVAQHARGDGLGRRLLGACEGEAARRGASRMRLEVRPDNAAALRLYMQEGYVPVGEVPAYYEDGAPALRLEKTLAPGAGAA